MSLHDCMYCDGTGKLDASNMTSPDETTNEFVECGGCDGKGQLEECQCSAYEPLECICGAWNDIDLDEWYSYEED